MVINLSEIANENYSWISPKIQLKKSYIHGSGYFAKENIGQGEVTFVKGGRIKKRIDMFSSSIINSYLPISDCYCICSDRIENEEHIKLYVNHSCNPNCGMHGEITFVAIRDINAGEELTIDYAFVDNEDYSFECHCGSENCRGIVTGFDWKIKELQEKYYPYFAQYLRDKIDLLRNE